MWWRLIVRLFARIVVQTREGELNEMKNIRRAQHKLIQLFYALAELSDYTNR